MPKPLTLFLILFGLFYLLYNQLKALEYFYDDCCWYDPEQGVRCEFSYRSGTASCGKEGILLWEDDRDPNRGAEAAKMMTVTADSYRDLQRRMIFVSRELDRSWRCQIIKIWVQALMRAADRFYFDENGRRKNRHDF